ncbi:transport and Golgi organization 2 homolog [Chenopodium quinoa]|uniref:transport and Golgi organization 2 homolog n=1 Tax=Chenopodium quinoa TaxID=63459 RepID=UPI000B786A4D|nr:transport and Golgi organization 2 homolog [Chenopodium quinoa]
MCITAFAWQALSLHPFVLLLNRDEDLNRPTKPLGWWEGGEILGGRDEVGGGTWLACTKKGKVAFITNVLELHTLADAKSRGELPVRFLKGKQSPREYAEMVAEEAHEYNGFNLIVADLLSKSMIYITNRPKGESARIQEVPPGIHVLTNGRLDSPWPKAERLALKFKKLLYRYDEGEIPVKDMVNKVMRDTKKADESKLPHICSLDWEFRLSSIFVKADSTSRYSYYCTRSTAAVTVSGNGEVNFYETYLEKEVWKEHIINYCIEKPKHV